MSTRIKIDTQEGGNESFIPSDYDEVCGNYVINARIYEWAYFHTRIKMIQSFILGNQFAQDREKNEIHHKSCKSQCSSLKSAS